MKFSSVPAGKREERETTLPRPHASSDSAPTVRLVLCPLSAGEEIEVLTRARADATEAGCDNPRPGDPIFDRYFKAHVLSLGCFDAESDPKDRALFFDGGVPQILDKRNGLDPSVLALLYEEHEVWQDLCSVSITKVSTNDLVDRLVAFSELEDDRPFLELSPAMRVISMRTMARQLLHSRGSKSSRTSPAPGSSKRKTPRK